MRLVDQLQEFERASLNKSIPNFGCWCSHSTKAIVNTNHGVNKGNDLNGGDLSGEGSMLIKPTKNMKKVIYALILPLVVVTGLVYANREIKNETSKNSTLKPLSTAEMKAEKEKWEATPEGIKYKKWEASPEGKKVLAGAAKIGKQISAFTNMEAVVTSLSLPPG